MLFRSAALLPADLSQVLLACPFGVQDGGVDLWNGGAVLDLVVIKKAGLDMLGAHLAVAVLLEDVQNGTDVLEVTDARTWDSVGKGHVCAVSRTAQGDVTHTVFAFLAERHSSLRQTLVSTAKPQQRTAGADKP